MTKKEARIALGLLVAIPIVPALYFLPVAFAIAMGIIAWAAAVGVLLAVAV